MTEAEFISRFSYKVPEDKIGGGSFGTVYKAYDNTLNREVAIKVSEVKLIKDKRFSLKDEFDALKNVPKHHNVANYEEFYTIATPHGEYDYAVMQYYRDGNLSQAIRDGLSEAQKEQAAKELLDGIAFLHAHNVVHRDLKPGNILVVKRGDKITPLITDFGLSKVAKSGANDAFSNSFGGGTLKYSSPEQLQGKELRLNTDLWAYGTIVYEIFAGVALFSSKGTSASAKEENEIYSQIVNGLNLERLSTLPDKWRQVVERCLVVNPAARVQTARELQDMILESVDMDGDETHIEVDTNPTEDPVQPFDFNVQADNDSKKGKKESNPKKTGDKKNGRLKKVLIGLGAFVVAFILLIIIVGIFSPSNVTKGVCNPDTTKLAQDTIVEVPIIKGTDAGGDYEWHGGAVDGKPDGVGLLIYGPNDKFQRKDFKGEMKAGVRVAGRLTYANGDVYSGSFDSHDNFVEGKYTVAKDGSYYRGPFKNNLPTGKWRTKDGAYK